MVQNEIQNKYAFEETYNAFMDIAINDFKSINKYRCFNCNAIVKDNKMFCGSTTCKQKYYLNKYGAKKKCQKKN